MSGFDIIGYIFWDLAIALLEYGEVVDKMTQENVVQ